MSERLFDIIFYTVCICFSLYMVGEIRISESVNVEILKRVEDSKIILSGDAAYRCQKVLSDIGNKRGGK